MIMIDTKPTPEADYVEPPLTWIDVGLTNRTYNRFSHKKAQQLASTSTVIWVGCDTIHWYWRWMGRASGQEIILLLVWALCTLEACS